MKTQLVNLKGGAKLLFNKQTEVNGVSVVFSFNAGAINDPEGKLGVAHCCEHVLYSFPNAKFTRQQKFEFARNFQYSNAFTSPRDMRFVIRTIDNKLEEAFDFLTESFNSIKFSQEEFEIEQKIIRDEINTRKKSNQTLIYRIYNTEILDNDKTKYLTNSPAGNLETFNRITLSDIEEFIGDYLTLNNLTIIVVGNTSLAKVKKLIKKYVETRLNISNKQCYMLKNPEIHEASYHFIKADEEGKAIFNVYYPLKKLPFRYERYRESFVGEFVSAVLNELTFNFYRIEKNLCYGCSAGIYYSDDWLSHEFSIPCGEENLQDIIDLYEDYMNSLPKELPRELFDKHRDRKLNNFNFDFMKLDGYSSVCLSYYENRNELYNTKIKKKVKELYESINYQECNEFYKSLFKVKPHVSIVSNNEKYKDFNYQDFKATKK